MDGCLSRLKIKPAAIITIERRTILEKTGLISVTRNGILLSFNVKIGQGNSTQNLLITKIVFLIFLINRNQMQKKGGCPKSDI